MTNSIEKTLTDLGCGTKNACQIFEIKKAVRDENGTPGFQILSIKEMEKALGCQSGNFICLTGPNDITVLIKEETNASQKKRKR